ncbi:MAG: TIR domain-containing protein [Nitrospirota bacterium]
MPKVVLIDDDYATEILAENLGFRGLDVRRIGSATEARRLIDEIANADAVVLDVIMEQPEGVAAPKVSGDRNTGMLILRALRERNPDIPVLVFSATNDADLIDTLRAAPNTEFLSKWSTPSLREFLETVERVAGISRGRHQPKSFIVHGHDEAAKLSVKNYLQNTLRLPEPMILHEQPSIGRTIIEKFEGCAAQTDLVFVLMTPDDRDADPTGTNDDKRRARQNVIFELGYFLGALGRSSGRVLLLYKGPLELPSDLSGVIYIDISGGVDAAGESIRRELARVI